MIEKRVDDAHERAARRLRADMEMQREFTREQIDAVADALEEYESKKVFDVFARYGNIPSWDVAMYNRVVDVRTYSDNTLKAFFDKEDRIGRITEVVRDELQEEGKSYAGFQYDGIVYLNVTALVNAEDVKERNADNIRARATDVLHHENSHGFFGFFATNGVRGDGLYRFNEGATELFSNIVTRDLSVAEKDPFSGYMGGETAAAAVVYESLPLRGQQTMWSSYVHGAVMEFNDVYNNAFGKNAFGDMVYRDDLHFGPNAKAWIAEAGITHYDEKNVRGTYLQVASLDRALEYVGDDWPAVTERANMHLGTGLIVPIRGENINGVLVVSNYSHNELTAGLLRLDGTKGRRIALLTGQDDYGLFVLPGTNVAYLSVDLDAYSMSRKDLEQQTFAERGTVAVKMLRAHRSALLHFREM